MTNRPRTEPFVHCDDCDSRDACHSKAECLNEKGESPSRSAASKEAAFAEARGGKTLQELLTRWRGRLKSCRRRHDQAESMEVHHHTAGFEQALSECIDELLQRAPSPQRGREAELAKAEESFKRATREDDRSPEAWRETAEEVIRLGYALCLFSPEVPEPDLWGSVASHLDVGVAMMQRAPSPSVDASEFAAWKERNAFILSQDEMEELESMLCPSPSVAVPAEVRATASEWQRGIQLTRGNLKRTQTMCAWILSLGEPRAEAPAPCCQDYASCDRPCVLRGRWLEQLSPSPPMGGRGEPEQPNATPQPEEDRVEAWRSRFEEWRLGSDRSAGWLEPLRDEAVEIMREMEGSAKAAEEAAHAHAEQADEARADLEKVRGDYTVDVSRLTKERDEALHLIRDMHNAWEQGEEDVSWAGSRMWSVLAKHAPEQEQADG